MSIELLCILSLHICLLLQPLVVAFHVSFRADVQMRILDESLKLDGKGPLTRCVWCSSCSIIQFHLYITTTKYKYVVVSYAIHNIPISLIKFALSTRFKASCLSFGSVSSSFGFLSSFSFWSYYMSLLVSICRVSYSCSQYDSRFSFRFGLMNTTWINHPGIDLHPFSYPSSVHDNTSCTN